MQEDREIALGAESIAKGLELKVGQVEAVLGLLREGSTLPFIARYRKEITGGLDEVQIQQISQLAKTYAEFNQRREYILRSLRERELLTAELEAELAQAEDLAVLEDIFLPFKPKRRTRATVARERGLEPLALELLAQQQVKSIEQLAGRFVNSEAGVEKVEDALAGAGDIIAEIISEDSVIRGRLRSVFADSAVLTSSVVKKYKDKAEKYKDYFDWSEPAKRAPSHRLLAIYRGEREGLLRVRVRIDLERALQIISTLRLRKNCQYKDYLSITFADAYSRLIEPSLENELKADLKEEADKEAVTVFAQNLRELLLAAPLGSKRVLAIDPGIRTGCKVVMLSERGELLDNMVIYPDRKPESAAAKLRSWVERYAPAAVAVGNGTYGREAEKFVRGLKLEGVEVVLVSESGASIYSASEVARAEFPDYDLTVRGAVSIGRRLMDPLAELVKLEPKTIGVGQYQHDVDQRLLQEGLDSVVMSCVNAVGVELNTASKQLLTYVSGLGEKLAANIIAYRQQQGNFKSRAELLKVPRLGVKAFEQAAGFIRVSNSANPLDASAVHPESYPVVEQMAAEHKTTVSRLLADAELRGRIDINAYVSSTIGLPTLRDIMAELTRPGRDPREKFVAFAFDSKVESIADLQEGMLLPGIVTNVTKFGAFVDIGVHQDGLVHISQLADKYVRDPAEVVRVQQQVRVRVLEVDPKRKRIALSMKG